MPYPTPSSAAASAKGRANKRTDTKPEIALRSELHRRGRRFRKDLLVRAGEVRAKPDVVFTKKRIAIFIDGCFWHCCPTHGTMPRSNVSYWEPKLAANVARDVRITRALQAEGWMVLRIWEHVPPEQAADLVESALTDA